MVVVQVVVSLPLTGREIWTELLTPGFGLVKPRLLQASEERLILWRSLIVSLPLALCVSVSLPLLFK